MLGFKVVSKQLKLVGGLVMTNDLTCLLLSFLYQAAVFADGIHAERVVYIDADFAVFLERSMVFRGKERLCKGQHQERNNQDASYEDEQMLKVRPGTGVLFDLL